MTAIALRHVFIYGMVTADRAQSLSALDRVDTVFGPPTMLCMLLAPICMILLAAAAWRARLVSWWVLLGAVVFAFVDDFPLPATEEIQGLIGIVTFTLLVLPLIRTEADVPLGTRSAEVARSHRAITGSAGGSR